MFCALPVEPLLAALLAPAAPRRRIAVTLPAAHAALLEAAAAAHFRSRTNAAARALLAHAMAGGGRGWAMAPRRAPCAAPAGDLPPAQPVMVVLQVGALQHDWLAALGSRDDGESSDGSGSGSGSDGGDGDGEGCGCCGKCAAAAGGVDGVVARVLEGYAAMTPKGCEALLARLGEEAALRERWDEKAPQAAVAAGSPGAQSLAERLLA